MTFSSSQELVALMAGLLLMLSAETAAESGTMTVAGCRLQPLSPPPSTPAGERCNTQGVASGAQSSDAAAIKEYFCSPWYLDQIAACGRISPADTAASALATYRRKANELNCRVEVGGEPDPGMKAQTLLIEVSPENGAPDGTRPEGTTPEPVNHNIITVMNGCRYQPLAPPLDVPESERCRWYEGQIEACDASGPMTMNGASVYPAVTYRKQASLLGCHSIPTPTDEATTDRSTLEPDNHHGMIMIIEGCRYKPLAPPPDLPESERCRWYEGQIQACKNVPVITNGAPVYPAVAYRKQASLLGCHMPGNGESGTVNIAGCRYKPLAPPPDVPDSERCRWYAGQIQACQGRAPMDIDGASVDPAVTYRTRASLLGCYGIQTPTDEATPGRSTLVPGNVWSGTVTISGCRYKPLAPPPDVPDSERCRWYAGQIKACQESGPMNIDGASVDPVVTYRKRASLLRCNGAGSGLASCLLLCVALSALAYLLTWFN